MANRLLTLTLCLAVLAPQQFCACRVVAHSPPPLPPTAGPVETAPSETGRCCAHSDRAGGASLPPAGVDEAPPAACPCGCHSDPCGPAGCPHSVREAVAEAPKSGAGGESPGASPPFAPFLAPPTARSSLRHDRPPPRSGRVPLYLTFCNLRN